MFRNAALPLALWIIPSVTMAGLAAWNWHASDSIELSPAGAIRDHEFDRFWFSPQGDLLTAHREGLVVVILRLQPSATDPVERDVILPFEDAPWAISSDGLQAAWVDRKAVTVAKAFGGSPEQPFSRPMAGSSMPLRIGFAENGMLVIAFSNGDLQLLDPAKMEPRGSGHLNFADPDTMEFRGPFLAIASRSARRAEVFDFRESSPLAENVPLQSAPIFTRLVLSPAGQLGFITEQGAISTQPALQAPGAVRAFDYNTGGGVIAGGAFDGLFLLASELSPRRIALTSPGVSQIAMNSTHLAFAGSRGTFLLSHRVVPVVISPRNIGYAWIGFTGFALAGCVLLRRRSKKRPSGAPLGVPATCALDKFPPPDDLLAAMRKAECVLVGGEQLSIVSAVLPWSKLLRSLTDWLAETGSLNDKLANQIRTCAVKNDTDMAWKLLLPGMQGRQAAILEYARSAYMRPAPLTKVHEAAARLSFSGVITPNLDWMLEKAFEHRAPQCLAASETDLFSGGFCVLKLRGVWERSDTIILDPQTAADSNRQNENYRKFVEATHAVHRLIFLGTSPPETRRMLEGLNLKPQPTQHLYVLAAIAADNKSIPKEWAQLQGIYGFTLLTYVAGDTGPVCQFFEKLGQPDATLDSQAVSA